MEYSLKIFLFHKSCCPQLHVGMQREYLLIKTIDTRAAAQFYFIN
jgi:hypothetical protein